MFSSSSSLVSVFFSILCYCEQGLQKKLQKTEKTLRLNTKKALQVRVFPKRIHQHNFLYKKRKFCVKKKELFRMKRILVVVVVVEK